MIRYLLQKLYNAFLTLLGVVTLVFLLFHVLPGDPARMMLDQNENAEQLALVKQKFGFDQPLYVQYLWYLNDLSPLSYHAQSPKHYTHWENNDYSGFRVIETSAFTMALKQPYLRESFQKSGKKVVDIIGETLPNTFILAIAAIGLAIVLGLVLGVFSALKANSWIDRMLALISTLGMSIPSFFSAILFAWLFGYVWHKHTGLHMTGSLYEVDDFGNGQYIQWKNLILPAVVLGIRPLAVVTQLMRNSLLEVLSQDYIRTAKAKGLSMTQIIWKHALRNALNPVVTAISGWFASLLAGAVFVEYIFGWNGLGKEIVEALNQMDLPLLMGAVLVIATTFVIINIIVDFIYAWLDPRIRV